MFKIERKIVEFVERNVNILFILAITGLAIAVRYAGRENRKPTRVREDRTV